MIVVNEVVKFDIDRNAVGGDQRFVAIGYNPRMLDGSEKNIFLSKNLSPPFRVALLFPHRLFIEPAVN